MQKEKTRQSGAEWLDGVLIEQMADELRDRGADLGDHESVRTALRAANFGAPAIERLADCAAKAAGKLQHA